MFEVQKWTDREVKVIFHGEKDQGRYVLFATGGRNGQDWMIHRMDPPSDPDRQPLPSGDELRPMLATPGDLPTGEGWRYEPWWPGQRLVVPFDGGRPIVPTGLRLPELAALGEALGSLAVVLDGVVVAIADDGRPDRARLERRLAATSAASARRLAGRVPLTFVVVDLLWVDGRSVTHLGLDGRRALLDQAVSRGPAWVVTPRQSDGEALLLAAGDTGFAGVIAKREGSPYHPGLTSPDWVASRAPAA